MQLILMKETVKGQYKGDIIEVRATGTPFGSPPYNVMVEVPDIPMLDFEGYNDKWNREIAFAVVASDPVQDGFRLRMYASNASSVLGKITKAEVETFINSWNGLVHSFADNEVVFDIKIYDALTSAAFWEIQNVIENVTFNEISYDQGTSIHRISLDYSALGNNPTYVERYVSMMGLTVISHANKVLVYEADRSVVRMAFQDDLEDKTRKPIQRRRYHVSEAVVDTIIANGNTMTVDQTTLMTYLKDKTVE